MRPTSSQNVDCTPPAVIFILTSSVAVAAIGKSRSTSLIKDPTVRRIDLKKAQTARLTTIRDINRQIVLNYVREREPISRAEIARESALQRSTVSAIVDDLQHDGLIEEVGEGESTGGRPPTLLRLRTAGAIAIGVAVTPSVTTIATSDLAGRVFSQESFPTDQDADRTFDEIIGRIRQ